MDYPSMRRRPAITGWSRAIALLIGIAITICLPAASALAADESTIVSIGESNSDAQRAELLDLFEATDATVVIDVTVDETLETWDGLFDLTGVDSAYSSTALTCGPLGTGVDVATSNIEVVPPELYALALVTAGLTDVQLIVAAPEDAPALGMTALTGVFKTWDQSPCAGLGDDPVRRQLALEQLALVAEIGQNRGGGDAIQSATDLVLSLQQSVVLDGTQPDDLDAMVASRAEEYGLELGSDERAAVVDLLARISDTDLDWMAFADDWSVDYAADDTRVIMRPGTDREALAVEARATGVGGRVAATQPASPSPTSTVIATPTAQPTIAPSQTAITEETVVPSATAATEPVGGALGPTDIDGPSTSGGTDRPSPWWLLLGIIPLGMLILLLAARRRRHAPSTPARVSRTLASEAVARRRAEESGAAEPVAGSIQPSSPVMVTAGSRTDRPSSRFRTGRIARRLVDTRLSRG